MSGKDFSSTASSAVSAGTGSKAFPSQQKPDALGHLGRYLVRELLDGDDLSQLTRDQAADELKRLYEAVAILGPLSVSRDDLLEALKAVDSEILLTGQIKDIVDEAIAKAGE